METNHRKTVRVGRTFPSRKRTKGRLEELSLGSSITLRILRGRITTEEQTFDLEVSGKTRLVDKAIRILERWAESSGWILSDG